MPVFQEEEAALAEIDAVTADVAARKRRLKKKINERRAKLQRRIDMKMHGTEEVDLAEAAGQQHGLFDLTTMDADEQDIETVLSGERAELSDDDEEEEALDLSAKDPEDYDAQEEAWLNNSYAEYKNRRGSKATLREKRAASKQEEEMPYLLQAEMDLQDGEEGEPERGVEDFGSDGEDEDLPKRRGNVMLDDLDDSAPESSMVKANRFFSGDLFDGIEDEVCMLIR